MVRVVFCFTLRHCAFAVRFTGHAIEIEIEYIDPEEFDDSTINQLKGKDHAEQNNSGCH
jgi:hypothetical protein